MLAARASLLVRNAAVLGSGLGPAPRRRRLASPEVDKQVKEAKGEVANDGKNKDQEDDGGAWPVRSPVQLGEDETVGSQEEMVAGAGGEGDKVGLNAASKVASGAGLPPLAPDAVPSVDGTKEEHEDFGTCLDGAEVGLAGNDARCKDWGAGGVAADAQRRNCLPEARAGGP